MYYVIERDFDFFLLLIEGGCSPINICHRVIASSLEDIMTSLLTTLWPFLNLIQIYGLSRSIVRLSYTEFSFSLT